MANITVIAFEVLKMARDIVINEYIDRRAQDHNKWLVESDFLWKSQRLRLAYPSLPAYPTEQDIVVRANVLLNFISNSRNREDVEAMISSYNNTSNIKEADNTFSEFIVNAKTKLDKSEPETKETALSAAQSDKPIKFTPSDVEEEDEPKISEEKPKEQITTNLIVQTEPSLSDELREHHNSSNKIADSAPQNSSGILPGLMKKIEELKNSLSK